MSDLSVERVVLAVPPYRAGTAGTTSTTSHPVPVVPGTSTWPVPLVDDWRNAAACRGEDPALWCPEDCDRGSNAGAVEYQRRATAALAVCARCPVAAPCLADALTTEETDRHGPFGIRGGRTAHQRREQLDRDRTRRALDAWTTA